MAILKFKRITKSGKSAVCLIKSSEFEFGGTPVYTPVEPWGENPQSGDSVVIPENYTLVDMVDVKTSEVLTTKDGKPRKVLQFH